MTAANEQDLVERIHTAGCQCVVALTGGGSVVIPALLSVPGASASMLEARVPYSAAALGDWLGGKFDQACSEPTARAMAMAGFERARQLSEADPLTLRGIGATASLVSNRPKRGPHRIHVAWQSAAATVSYSCELTKGQRTRVEEESLAAELVLHAVAEACVVVNVPPRPASPEEPIARRETLAPKEWTELLLGQRQSVAYRLEDPPRAVFSGAFNPLHDAHRRMADLAAARLNTPVALELSIANVDKPTLDFLEIESRLAALGSFPVLLTRAPTFVEKAALAPGATFIVGADTIARIADEKYYDCNCDKRDSAIARIAGCGCRFLVFGRQCDGRFVLPSELGLPSQLRDMCDEVPANVFRFDISSTELRSDS
jgi:nicotinamide mononucleotide (NMN) deamidase PncC